MRSTDRHQDVVLTPEDLQRALRRRTRRDFLVGGVAALAGVAGYEWLTKTGQENGTPWPQRRVLDLNREIARGYLSDGHLMPTYQASDITFLKANGDVGLDEDWDQSTWKLTVQAPSAPVLHLGMADVKALPRIEMITRFCCIEGWSVVTSWAGARFSDFTRKYFPPGRALPPYVYMATPDEEYYVGLDRKSALHPQTLLAYEHNGKPLEAKHGAPLRLVIPVKYGIKNIKRVASIRYTAEQPGDYWAEEGYDWFAGL